MNTQPLPLDDNESEARLLATAIEAAEANPARIAHADIRAWFLRLADGEFSAPKPQPRIPRGKALRRTLVTP